MSVSRIQHNLSAMNAMSNYQGNNNTLTGNLEKLSSGYRINSAADDAAGLAISEKMRSQIAGLEKAQDNANDGISLIQTAEGALTEVNSMLTRLTTLATQSANGTYSDGVDRANIQEETEALLEEIDRISQSTNFNGINLLDGSMSNAGVKETTANVSVNNVALNALSSTESKADVMRYTLEQNDKNGNDPAKLNAGETYAFKLNYTDSFGNDKTASVSFTASDGYGSDGAIASTKNLAEAINKDTNLATHFTASVDKDNNLVLTSNIKAAVGVNGDSTTGAAHAKDTGASVVTSTGSTITINNVNADDSYTISSAATIYKSNGVQITNADGLKDAIADGETLHTDREIISEATIKDNTVGNAAGKITLTSAAADQLTSNTVLTLSKHAGVDSSSSATSNALGTVTLTDEAKALTSDTTFTFKLNASIGNVTDTVNIDSDKLVLTDEANKLTNDKTIKFVGGKADNTTNASDTAATISSSDVKVTLKGASLVADTTFTYTSAGIEGAGNATGTVAGVSVKINSAASGKVHLLKADTTFTYDKTSGKWLDGDNKAVSIGDYITSAADVTAAAASASGTTSFTINAAKWNASGGVNGEVDIEEYISAGSEKVGNGKNKIFISGSKWVDSTDNTDVDVKKYISEGLGDAITSGATIQIKATNTNGEGVWTATGGLEGTFDENEIKSYFTFSSGDANGYAATGDKVTVKAGSEGEWTIKGGNDELDGKTATYDNLEAWFGATTADKLWNTTKATSDDNSANSKMSKLNDGGQIKINARVFEWGEDDGTPEEGTDYTVTRGNSQGATGSKTYDLSSLNDGDRIQINGKNYTYRANDSDVKSATDFHNGGQLAAMSQAISAADPDKLDKITVKDQFEEGDSLTLQVGDTNSDYQKVSVDIKDMSTVGLGLSGLDLSTQDSAAAAIDTIKAAVNAVSTQRGKLGALQNRLDHTLNNLDATTQNITAAESQIRDVDMAKEMTQYSKNNILVQAAQSMLAQANSLPQGVLSLLQ